MSHDIIVQWSISEKFIYFSYLSDTIQAVHLEQLIVDDDSANDLKHLSGRLYGGGRRLGRKYTYKCKWCPKKDLKHSQHGRFTEFRNYKEHFKKHHSDLPLDVFLTTITKRDPKWFCPKVNNSSYMIMVMIYFLSSATNILP